MDSATDSIDVLLVDDDAALAATVATALERADDRLAVRTAECASEGLDALATGGIDCVVSDYEMPGLDGIEFLSAVRERDADLPFILLTGRGSEDVASEAISAGVTDYVQKRFGADGSELLGHRITNAVEQRRAERATGRTERRLLELADHTADVLWMFTSDWEELLFANSAYEEIWGRSLETLQADPEDLLEGVHPEDRERTREAMARLSNGQAVDLEYRVNPGEDYGRWVWVQGEPIFEDGEVVRVVGFVRDVTERKRREQTLAGLHDRTRDLVQAESPAAVADLAVQATKDLLGMPVTGCWLYDEEADALEPAAVTDEGLELIPDPPTYRAGEGLAWEAFETGELRRYGDVGSEPGRYNAETAVESELILPLGEYGVLITGSETVDEFDDMDESLAQVLAANTEAALARAERLAQLRSEREFVDAALNALDDIFYVFDQDGRALRWNDNLVQVTGYDDAEIASMDPVDFFVPDDRERVARALDNLPTADRARLEATLQTRDGECVPYEVTAAELRDSAGEHIGFAGVGRDITDRKRREKRLREANAKLEAVMDTVSASIFMTDADGRYLLMNQTCREWAGIDPDADVTELTLEDRFPPDLADRFAADNERVFEAGGTIEYEEELPVAGGETRTVLTLKSPIYDADGEPAAICAVSTDISPQKERERNLRRYETILENVEDAVFMFDSEGRCTFVNQATVEQTGTDREGLVGEPIEAVLSLSAYDEPRFQEYTALVEQLLNDERNVNQLRLAPTTDYEGERAADVSLTRVESTDGELLGVVGIARDMTDYIDQQRELERQNERLDRFVSVVAHDLQNPLQVAISNVDLYRHEAADRYLDNVSDAHDQMHRLIDDLLALARQGEAVEDLRPVSLATIARDAIADVADDVSLVVTEDCRLRADPDRFQQLVDNLVRNSVEHGSAGRQRASDDPAVTITVGALPDGAGFFLADDGPGIPEPERERVFEHGYTTSEDGTGFGLSIVQEISDAHGWELAISESDAGGARFEVTGVELVDD